ncbi:MAG TPA: AarF/UbiB family protein, partial [Pyrinomonadaceae bacterium]|nr:AarF/UbiB family protein [Pyrinomonadaceae bacterium]
MTQDQALVKTNGNGLATASVPEIPKPSPPVQPLTQEMVDEILSGRGLRGWLRAARVARVLGLFSLYLFLDTYDVRADFNRRTVARLRDLARDRGRLAQFKAWISAQLYAVLDRFIRVLRYVIFRGAEGSASKQSRLQKQAAWMRESLIDLGPTFIKIGQALGTRADLLPLEYVKELARLQDQVPAFSTSEAFATIESELGRSLHEAYAEIDNEPIAAA